jgi:cytochrome b561/polyisoprenoid-binding protein YceI
VKAVYTPFARYLHWIVAGLIVLQYVLANWAEALEESNAALRQLAVLANHKSVGMTILMLAVVRLVWRFMHKPPALPQVMPGWQRTSAHTAHWLLYGFLFAVPISGWLMSSASAYTVSWFNLFSFPDLVAPGPELKEFFGEVHELLTTLLLVTALLHIVAALVHRFRDHNDILQRMLRPVPFTVGTVLLVLGVWQLGFVASQPVNTSEQATEQEAQVQSQIQVAKSASTLPVWDIDYGASAIDFTGEQAGASFSGTFNNWQADVQFDPAHLDSSRASVLIELGSVDTQDKDRDDTLGQAEWFAGAQARFHASEFAAGEDGEIIATNATLAFGDRVSEIDFRFHVQVGDDGIVLDGQVRLDRLALGVGTGDWTDTTWVGQFVDVDIRVVATQ